MNLTELGHKYATDKATYHDYCGFYEQVLEPIRPGASGILEVGIATGASLRMWRDYFPAFTNIYGIDICIDNAPALPNVHCAYADQNSAASLQNAMSSLAVKEKGLDLIMDDGGHMVNQQRNTMEALWPFLRAGGIYILEDLHTNVPNWFSNHFLNESSSMWDRILLLMQGKPSGLQLNEGEVDRIVLWSRPKSQSMTCILWKK